METVAMALSLPSQAQKHQAFMARVLMAPLWRKLALKRLACMGQPLALA
jgi:hypothetical protein